VGEDTFLSQVAKAVQEFQEQKVPIQKLADRITSIFVPTILAVALVTFLIWLFVPADGKRGSGKRVEKCFPVIPEWQGDLAFYILDETITEDVFRYHLEQAGKFIGIGFFRPRNNGYFGRFEVVKMTWETNQ